MSKYRPRRPWNVAGPQHSRTRTVVEFILSSFCTTRQKRYCQALPYFFDGTATTIGFQ